MKVFDVSRKISPEMVFYPGDPRVEVEQIKDLLKDGVVLSAISLGAHSGTHIDAPAHYIREGMSIDAFSIESFMGDCVVLDLTQSDKEVSKKHLEDYKIDEGKIVLLKTRNSELLNETVFNEDFIYLSNDGADYLIERKIKAVGIDYLSIEKFGSTDNYVHKTLLGKSIPIIEGLDLREVQPGQYRLICLPLRIIGGEAAPARCILIQD